MNRSLCFVAALSLGLIYTPRANAGADPADAAAPAATDEAPAATDEAPAATDEAPAATDEAPAEPAKEETEDSSDKASEETTDEKTDEKTEDTAEADKKEGESTETKTATSDPKNWWKQSVRKDETPILQEIFNSMPRPVRKKGNAKLLYHRAVPVVVTDIHNTTTLWGGKGQTNVRFMGISKVHSTTTMDPISETTPGIAYCPINCDRITNITTTGQNISIMYDSEIKEWGGKASDVHAGYTRKVGKHHRAICTFPVLYNLAPASAWLDPEEVAEVQTSAVNEINRYCGR